MRTVLKLTLVAFAVLATVKATLEVKSVQFTESTEERQAPSLRERREADPEVAAFPIAEGPWRGEGRPRPLPRPVRSVHFSESTEQRQEASLRDRREADAEAAAYPVAEGHWRGSVHIIEPYTYTYNKWPRPIPRPV